MNTFQARTHQTFDRLRNGEVNIDDMTLSELKSYFTGIGFFKQEELIHYQLIQHAIQLRELYERYGRPQRKQTHTAKKPTVEPDQPVHPHQQNIGRRLLNWATNFFPFLKPSPSEQTKGLLNQ